MKTKTRAVRFTESEENSIKEYAQANQLSFSEVIRLATMSLINESSKQRLSLYDVANNASDNDFDLLFGQFLDDFSHAQNKGELIAIEPHWPENTSKHLSCLLAATAHKLAHDNSLPVPQWALKKTYISETPIYGMQTKNPDFQQFLRDTTPIEFSCHNLFLGENVLSRA